MSEQSGFAVPKSRRDVTVLGNSGKKSEGSVFLDCYPEELSIHHRMLAFLQNGTPFFPLLIKGSNETEFIYKNNVRLIELQYADDQEKVNEALNLMHTESISAVFMDETSVCGLLLAEVPEERNRLSDCLNLHDAFISVKIETRICYINKNALQKVLLARP